jgi:hypothetical protein
MRIFSANTSARLGPFTFAARAAPRLLLRLEALATMVAAILAYRARARAGSVAYNAAHSYVGPALLAALGLAVALPECLLLALIWVAHIGLDRAFGYGLKYATSFGDTHLGRIGRTSLPGAQPR